MPNDIQNIDPTVLVDDDGRVFLYWGTFGRLKGVELERDMVTFKGTPVKSPDCAQTTAWIYSNDNPYYAADNRPKLWAWDIGTGKTVWEKDFSEYGLPPADKVIAHTNEYWTWQDGPGRTATVADTADVTFD